MFLYVTKNLLEKALSSTSNLTIIELTPRNVIANQGSPVPSAILYGEGSSKLPLQAGVREFIIHTDESVERVQKVINVIESVMSVDLQTTTEGITVVDEVDEEMRRIPGTGYVRPGRVMMDPAAYAAARSIHEVNRAWCFANGDDTQVDWDSAPDWVQESVLYGVKSTIDNPDITPAQSHENWCDVKIADGWVYGPVKDPVAKTHPCLVSYDEMPPEQQVKDFLFQTTVRAVLEAADMAGLN